jgi:hypothetical protein
VNTELQYRTVADLKREKRKNPQGIHAFRKGVCAFSVQKDGSTCGFRQNGGGTIRFEVWSRRHVLTEYPAEPALVSDIKKILDD